jgi:hypothetical protein
MANIKGFGIRGLLRYVKETKPGTTPELLSKLPADVKPLFDRPIVSSNMYPYRAFSELLRVIDRQIGHGDLRRCEDVGDFAARQDISGMFKIMLSVLSPKTTLERSNLFWTKYCDTGKLTLVSADPKNSVMRLEGFPGMDEAHCYLMNGWIARFATMTGGKGVTVRHTACVNHGGAYCEWAGNWL